MKRPTRSCCAEDPKPLGFLYVTYPLLTLKKQACRRFALLHQESSASSLHQHVHPLASRTKLVSPPHKRKELLAFTRAFTLRTSIEKLIMSLFLVLVVVACLLAAVQAFAPTNSIRASVRGSTIVMDGKTRVLRDRMKSVKNTRRITEAMRLVCTIVCM
jgi:hypothetical protein